jgi:predicted CoA-binding protein
MSEQATISARAPRYHDPETIREILRESKTIAVVGLSPNPERPSHSVSRYMQGQGYRIVPVNPNVREILGETCYPSLSAIPFSVDVVDVFRAAEATPPIAREAVAIGAKAIWFQLGVINDEAVAIAQEGGLKIVVDRCILVEHRRYAGTL